MRFRGVLGYSHGQAILWFCAVGGGLKDDTIEDVWFGFPTLNILAPRPPKR